MRFGVLALDYDGTIALDGVLDPDVRRAIGEARSCGIVVLIVTGRRVSDLKSLVGDIGFVDAVVAENGAAIAFPSGQAQLLAAPPPPSFLRELAKERIPFSVGQCVVEADAIWAHEILTLIQRLEIPLVLLFNRSRLMVLPQAVSKSVGLRAALSVLRLSVHNAIAIGDAENDHDLLRACEVGVAVGWGSQALKEIAEEVLQGQGPSAVAGYIRNATKQMRLPPNQLSRRHFALGTLEDGQALRSQPFLHYGLRYGFAPATPRNVPELDIRSPDSNPRPTQDQPKTNPRPTQDQPKTNPRPTQDQPKTNPRPTRFQPDSNPRPTQDQPKTNPRPTQDQPKTNPRPTQYKTSSTLFLAIFHALNLATTPANSLKFRFS